MNSPMRFLFMISSILVSMIACASCMQTGHPPEIPPPQYPLCFVEQTEQHIFDRIGKITPAPVKHALLIPLFMAENRQRFVSCPFVYRPGEPVVLPAERMPKQARYEGIVVLCAGYLPTTTNELFPNTDTINGKKSELIELSKARNGEESLRILDDWAMVLKSKSFSVTGRFEVLKEIDPAEGRYATSKELSYPLLAEYTMLFVWPYDAGTVVKIELTQEDRKIVDDFIQGERARFVPKDQAKDK